MTDVVVPFTHTYEQGQKWSRLAREDAGRTVRALSVNLDALHQPNSDGDTPADVAPALTAITEITRSIRTGQGRVEWQRLVDAGVAEALCKNAREMALSWAFLPGMPEHLIEQALMDAPSPYFPPLVALCHAAVNFSDLPTATDKKVIAALKQDWSKVMERLWDEPANSLIPDNKHKMERMVVAQMVVSVALVDPSFLSIIYEPSDMTIPVIARQWAHAGACVDAWRCGGTLLTVVEPKHSKHAAYIQAHPPPSSSVLLSRILLGVGPSAESTVAAQCAALVAAFAAHLPWLNGGDAEPELRLFNAVYYTSRDHAPEFYVTLRASRSFWRNAFEFLRRSHVNAVPDQKGRLLGHEHLPFFVGFAADVLHHAKFEDPASRELLITIFVEEGLFDVLDEVMAALIEMDEMPMQLNRLFVCIQIALPDFGPALTALVRSQLPRSRSMAFLFRHDMRSQAAQGAQPTGHFAGGQILNQGQFPDHNNPIWDHTVWQALASLQRVCRPTLCARRGCDSEGNKKCANCKETRYCGSDCQTRDWKEHKLVCGFMRVIARV